MELETILRVLKQKWRIVVPIFIITFGASLIFTLKQPRIYEARATYVANLTPGFANNKDIADVLNILSSRVEISTTYAEVADSRRLYTLAMQKLGLSPENRNNLSVSSRLIAGTNIIEIAVQGTDPILVRDFANAIGESTVEYVKNLYETFTLTPLDEAVTPLAPIEPKTLINLILGGIIGLVLGSSIAFLTYYYQTSEKGSGTYPDKGMSIESANLSSPSALQLSHSLSIIEAQFEATRRELDQIHAALRRTNYYAKDIRSGVRDLQTHFDGNHTGESIKNIGE